MHHVQVQQELWEAIGAVEESLTELRSLALPPPSSTTTPRLPNTTTTNNNARIHPRSLYSTSEPDFVALAHRYPALRQYLLPPLPSLTTTTTTRRSIDFTNPAACRELTRVLLHSDFGVHWDLPDGHLVPTLTNRLNYILWIEDLLNLSNDTVDDTNRIIKGLDVGCGASLIYPLLGAAACGWQFVGVDVTEQAIEWAHRNRDANPQLAERIEIRKVDMQPNQATFFHRKNTNTNITNEQGILTGAVRNDGETFSFCMCNPPFFEDMQEAGRNPGTAFGGTVEESVYPGGEGAFVRSMVEDSFVLRDRVHWYTTMVGKKATLKAIRKILHADHSVHVVRTTEFSQGQTSRWGIAWSFAAHPNVANKPLRQKNPRQQQEEETHLNDEEMKVSQKRQRAPFLKKKVFQVSVRHAGAAATILKNLEKCLLSEQGDDDGGAQSCALDLATYQLTVTAKAGGIKISLLAQQAKLFVVTVALDTAYASSQREQGAAWFHEILKKIELVLTAEGRVSM